jgi:uncharacterized membrane protein YgdD (TMEM256/DUF423 family)
MTTSMIFTMIGAVSGFLGVGAGAFGAHGLKTRLTSEMMQVYQTAVEYQLIHALALVAVGLMCYRTRRASLAGWFFATGTVLFSGSLYVIALGGPKGLGMVTPFGGTLFLAGWATMAISAWKSRNDKKPQPN